MKTFNYKKSKNVIEAAATHQQRNIYNFLKTYGGPRSLDVEIELCAKNHWVDEYYSFFRSCRYVAIGGSYDDKLSFIRSMTHAALKYGDVSMLNSVYSYGPSTFRDAFSGIHMFAAMINAIKSEDVQKIELIYTIFRHRSNEWSSTDFRDAIATGNMNTLKCVIEMWKGARPQWARFPMNRVKLYTIKDNRLVMLQYLDREIDGYPSEMMHEMRNVRGHSTQARREMITYVRGELLRARGLRRDYTTAPVAPAEERPTNLQKALAIIEDCGIQEGKYLELCNILMDVHRRGVR